MGKERVPRRPMTELERARAHALVFLRLKSGSDARRFADVLGARATGGGSATITEREAAALARLCWVFKGRLDRRGDGRLVPEEKPPDREEVAWRVSPSSGDR